MNLLQCGAHHTSGQKSVVLLRKLGQIYTSQTLRNGLWILLSRGVTAGQLDAS